MTTYATPDPVTNLMGKWHVAQSGFSLHPGISLSWTAPTVTSGTIGGYYIYVLLPNLGTQLIDQVFFTSVRRKTTRSYGNVATYSVGDPATTTFFPFSWVPPEPNPASPVYSQNGVLVGNSYGSFSFQVVTFLSENNEIQSSPTGVTVSQPNQMDMILPGHFNPRFNLNSAGSIEQYQQDSYQEVSSCVEMILNTPIGQRVSLPAFGIVDPTFTQINVNDIQSAIDVWEPRAKVAIDIQMDDSGLSGDTVGATNALVNVQITNIDYTT